MSKDDSKNHSSSLSESSSSSSNNQLYNSYTDLTLFGSSLPVFTRTGTVRRASTGAKKDVEAKTKSPRSSPDLGHTRRSLDSSARFSLESISEYKTKTSFSTANLHTSRECSSMESSASNGTDFAVRSATEASKDKTILSPGSSYLSWIGSVNSEYFSSALSQQETPDVDSKVGEWNNFWLNYNSARGHRPLSPHPSASNEEFSDAKSTCSTQREFTDKNSIDQIVLTVEEITEAIKCSQRVTEILQNALKKSELDDSKNDSYYSQSLSQQNNNNIGVTENDATNPARERSFSYVVDATELQKQKLLLKPPQQSSSTSCINALLNTTGVADILKRVMTKRRDVFGTEEVTSSRSSFSDWSSAK